MSVIYQSPESSSKPARCVRPPLLESIEAMWRELQGVESLDGKFLTLHHNNLYVGWKALNTKIAYIRDEYKQLLALSDENVAKDQFAMILRGPRGSASRVAAPSALMRIPESKSTVGYPNGLHCDGKSKFLLYVLWRAARSGKQVVWHGETVPANNVLMFHPNGNVRLQGKERVVPAYLSKQNPDCWYLVDDVEPCSTVNRTFVAASPDLKLDSFQLLMGDNAFVMHGSPWTEEELREAQAQGPALEETIAQ